MLKFKARQNQQKHDNLSNNMPVITQTIALFVFVFARRGLFYFQKVKTLMTDCHDKNSRRKLAYGG